MEALNDEELELLQVGVKGDLIGARVADNLDAQDRPLYKHVVAVRSLEIVTFLEDNEACIYLIRWLIGLLSMESTGQTVKLNPYKNYKLALIKGRLVVFK